MTPRTKAAIALSGIGASWLVGIAALALFVALNGGGCTPGGVTITEPGQGVLIVQEIQDRSSYTSAQLNAMDSQSPDGLPAYVRAKEGGVFAVLDKDDDVSQMSPVVREVWKAKRDSTPWLYVWKNRSLVGKPLGDDAVKTVKDKLR